MVDSVPLRSIEKSEIYCNESDLEIISRLCPLLKKYRENIAIKMSECITTGEMRIELNSNESVYRRQRNDRLFQADQVMGIEDLETNGIIRESVSPYASLVVLVRKKNDETRMAIDYRGLNKITKRINYPLPIIDNQIDQLVNWNTFISLDLKSWFYRINKCLIS